MKKSTLLLLLCMPIFIFSQVGIGTTTPNSSSALDVTATNKGFLPPRVTLSSTTDVSTIVNPAEGLLVYNLGSVGLQAGYYYWNNANWAIIATSSVAGSGVLASDLVKLYGEPYSTATGKIANASGYSFTVPVSGRYLFDFSCSGWGNALISFKVRQGTTDLGSDSQSSNNNNVHVEYNGKIEVNLQVGTTYNVFVSTTGNRDAGDYDRVYMKQVAGNLPVNVYPWVLNGNDVSTSGKVGIGTSSPTTTLDVNGTLNLSNTTSAPSINLKNGDAAATFNDNAQIKMGWSGSASGTNQYAQFIHTRHNAGPTNNAIDFYLSDGTANNTITSGSTRAMSIQSPGDVEISGKLNIGSASGNVATKVSSFVNAGTFLSMDNLKVTIPTSGSRGLSVCGVASNFTANISAWYGMVGGTAGSAAANVAYTTTPSGAAFGWNFPSEGDGSYYTIIDKTNNRMYRVTLIMGASHINNFICIERLY